MLYFFLNIFTIQNIHKIIFNIIIWFLQDLRVNKYIKKQLVTVPITIFVTNKKKYILFNLYAQIKYAL